MMARPTALLPAVERKAVKRVFGSAMISMTTLREARPLHLFSPMIMKIMKIVGSCSSTGQRAPNTIEGKFVFLETASKPRSAVVGVSVLVELRQRASFPRSQHKQHRPYFICKPLVPLVPE